MNIWNPEYSNNIQVVIFNLISSEEPPKSLTYRMHYKMLLATIFFSSTKKIVNDLPTFVLSPIIRSYWPPEGRAFRLRLPDILNSKTARLTDQWKRSNNEFLKTPSHATSIQFNWLKFTEPFNQKYPIIKIPVFRTYLEFSTVGFILLRKNTQFTS